ncbi:hypothetical protein [Streptomyces oceani]|uniref:Uncharacterized protein n=1 Tax=Streptomyces oceani TaxID=1075402 RepID=A0A1E7JXH9_9ACTN|nr:hypothetical protein [Streptomyces oceani]OEU96382.1 hypothetical protein AN216_20485 [Streptomyces oceani]
MTGSEGLEYLPEGYREGGRGSVKSADAAEGAQKYLRGVNAVPGSFGGASSYTDALNANATRQAEDAGLAAQDRNTMSDADHQAADLGEETDAAAAAAQRLSDPAGHSAIAQGITDGM